MNVIGPSSEIYFRLKWKYSKVLDRKIRVTLYDLLFMITLVWAIGATVCYRIALDAYKEVLDLVIEYECMFEDLQDLIR